MFNELLNTAVMTSPSRSTHSHGWVDNFGKNDWNYLETIVQEKNNTVKKAVLHFAKAQNGENILYDISFVDPIKTSNGNGLSVILTARNDNTIVIGKSQARKSTKDLTEKYSSLNLNVDISESGGVPAIRLIDGSVLPLSVENGRRIHFINIYNLKFIKF